MTRLRRFFAGTPQTPPRPANGGVNGHCGTLQISDLVAAVGIGADIAAEIPFSPARSQRRLLIRAEVPAFTATSWATLIRRIIFRRAVGILRHRGRLALRTAWAAFSATASTVHLDKTADDILDGITVKGFQRRTSSEASPLTPA
jgi:hypothetical protein